MNNPKPLELSFESNKIFNRTCSLWFVSCLAVAYFSSFIEINLDSYILYQAITNIMPAIQKMPLHSDYTKEAKFLWLYLPISSIVVLAILLYRIPDVKKKNIPMHVKIMLSVFLILGLFICIIGFEYNELSGGQPGLFGAIYKKTFIGMVLGSMSFFGCIIFPLFYFINWFIYT